MGEFTIECTLCGCLFGSEKEYDAHPCLEEDIKVPFKIKLEPRDDDEEAELEDATQQLLIEHLNNAKLDKSKKNDKLGKVNKPPMRVSIITTRSGKKKQSNDAQAEKLLSSGKKKQKNEASVEELLITKIKEEPPEPEEVMESEEPSKINETIEDDENQDVNVDGLEEDADMPADAHIDEALDNVLNEEDADDVEMQVEQSSDGVGKKTAETVENVIDAVAVNAVSNRNECAICGKRFYRREDYIKHTETSHKVPRPYQCKICKKKFTQRHYVTLHNRVHTGERPYKCTLCPNTYTHKTSFTIHMRIHNGERPYMCGVCGKKCYDKSGLTSHMRSHTKETPYECEVCGRRFTHSKSLLVHRRNHTGEKPYKCQYCGKCFRHWHKHKIHIRLHTGERPYKCDICGKGFPRNDEVKRHMRSHQGIKSFKCSICGVYCATQASITGHIDLHHSELKVQTENAPEKTVVRDSNSGILGTKAPQPRTIYKPITSLESNNTSSVSVSQPITSETSNIVTSNSSETNKKEITKVVSYKEYIELQEKLLTSKGLEIRNGNIEKISSNSTNTFSSSVKNKIATVVTKDGQTKLQNISIIRQKPHQTVSINTNTSKPNILGTKQALGQKIVGGKQVFFLPNQVKQVSQNGVSAQQSLGANKQVLLAPPNATAVGGPRIILRNGTGSQLIMPQTGVLGGTQQVLFLQPKNPQNSLGISQPMLILAGPGGTQRMVLLPANTALGGQNQKLVLKTNTPDKTIPPQNEISQMQQKDLDENIQNTANLVSPTPLVLIKQEVDNGSNLPGGVIIKQEPLEENDDKLCDILPASSYPLSFSNVLIKEEPVDT